MGQGGGAGVDEELGAWVYFEDRLCLYLNVYQFMGQQLGLECVTHRLLERQCQGLLLPFSIFCSAYSAWGGEPSSVCRSSGWAWDLGSELQAQFTPEQVLPSVLPKKQLPNLGLGKKPEPHTGPPVPAFCAVALFTLISGVTGHLAGLLTKLAFSSPVVWSWGSL